MATPSPLIVSAATSDALNAPSSDVIPGAAVATAYLYDTLAATGHDVLTFNKNDSFLTTVALFDNNNDGQIRFSGRKGVLMSDQTAIDNNNQGDTVQFTTIFSGNGLRYLGASNGQNVYATYTNKSALFEEGVNVIEGTVKGETLTGTAGKDEFLYDSALGLNLGADRITKFGIGDEIVTTSKFFDYDNDGQIRYGANKLFHLPGAQGGELNGGTLAIFDTSGARVNALYLTETETINGVTYYHYGLQPILAS